LSSTTKQILPPTNERDEEKNEKKKTRKITDMPSKYLSHKLNTTKDEPPSKKSTRPKSISK